MMNIGESTIITGLEKTGCKIGHIAHQLGVSGASKYHYKYYGPRVQKGTVDITTKNGTFTAEFRCENAWCTYLKFI